MKESIIPIGHPNRRGWKLDGIYGYVVHSTANLRPGTGDEFHARYFSRPFVKHGDQIFEADGKTLFRTGATHVVADADSETLCLPLDEYAPGAGDRPFPWEPINRGENPLARLGYAFRQNWRTIQIEICEPNRWDKKAEDRARDWIIDDIIGRGYRVDIHGSLKPQEVTGSPENGRVFIHRHYDITGKHCPTRMWADDAYWQDFVRYIAAATNGGQP